MKLKLKIDQSAKQLLIFAGIAFALPSVLGLLMGYAYSRGIDASLFSGAQTFYPAAGVMLAVLLTRKGDPLIPRRFFIGFLLSAMLLIIYTIVSIIIPGIPWVSFSQYVLFFTAILAWVLLLTEKKEKRLAYGLRGGHWKTVILIILLYLILFLGRTVLTYFVGGEMQTLFEMIQNPNTWLALALLPITFFFVFTSFFGEEYGWRYYLQPVLQKKMGLVPGIVVLGIVWGLWHWPINFFYGTSPSIGLINLTSQVIICITLGIFYGWAYIKTDNIWTVVWLHFINNNLIPIIIGDYTDVIQIQGESWSNVLFVLVVNSVFFMGVIFSKHYRDNAHRLPTINERADQYHGDIPESTQEEGSESGLADNISHMIFEKC